MGVLVSCALSYIGCRSVNDICTQKDKDPWRYACITNAAGVFVTHINDPFWCNHEFPFRCGEGQMFFYHGIADRLVWGELAHMLEYVPLPVAPRIWMFCEKVSPSSEDFRYDFALVTDDPRTPPVASSYEFVLMGDGKKRRKGQTTITEITFEKTLQHFACIRGFTNATIKVQVLYLGRWDEE